MNELSPEQPLADTEIEPQKPLESPDTESPADPQKMKTAVFWDLVRFVVMAAILVLGIRAFIAHPFIVSGASMEPTFESGEYLIVDELSYHLRSPERGEVVIFRYPKDTTKFFIKRIIGLPGETVHIKNNRVSITRGSSTQETLNEPYERGSTGRDMTVVLGDTEYFVMGDNREASSDSRSWGPVNEDLLIGRAVLRLFPVSRVDILPGVYHEEASSTGITKTTN